MEQSVARRAHNPKVVGSNPAPATHCFTFYAQIAQLVEQRTENPRVTGSIPVLGIFHRFSFGFVTEGDKRFSEISKLVTDLFGILAQVVEHLTFNQVVPGSSPGCLISLVNS